MEPGRPSPPARCRPILPDRATFDAPGTARIDGLLALVLLLTWVAMAAVLAPGLAAWSAAPPSGSRAP